MKKILALALLVPAIASAAPGTWAAISGLPRSTTFTCTQAGVTCDAPTSIANGTSLNGVGAVTVTVCAAAGQTLSGAGTLTAYVWQPNVGAWAKIPDLDITVNASSVRCQAFPAVYVPVGYGRVAWVPTSVTASSASLTVYINAAAPMAGSSPGQPM